MKRTSSFLLIALISVCISCKDRDPGLRSIDENGLSLYWHHTFGLDKGRYLLFSFMSAVQQRDRYEYVFDYEIKGREITVKLRETISTGQCPSFPGSWGDLCTSRGDIYIPENELSVGQYKLILQVKNKRVVSTFTVEADKYTLQVPSNDFFTNSISTVYPMPANLIFGSIYYQGATTKRFADALIADFEKLGLTVANLPDYPYRDMPIKQDHLSEIYVAPDFHAIWILFRLNGVDIKTAFETAQKHYALSGKEIGLSLYCSNNMEQLTGSTHDELKAYYAWK